MSDPPSYGFRPDVFDPAALSYAPHEMMCTGAPMPPPSTPDLSDSVGLHKAGYYWVNCSSYGGGVPPHAVRGGTDSDGSEIYVGRAYIEGDWCPAKVVPARNEAYVAYAGQEHCVNTFEVLCEQRFEWLPAYGGTIPPNAVCGGRTSDGEALYIGRTYHEGSNTVGKVHPSHNCLYIPYGGQELRYDSYEILVRM